jgi:hypothetical protein
VVVIDGLSAAGERLVEQACAVRSQFRFQSQFHPGIGAPAPASYREALRTALFDTVREAFGCGGDIKVTAASFSLVTTPAEDLTPCQRIPHFESTDLDELIVFHFLCQPHQGGASFYRHRRTGLEIVDQHNVEGYVRAVNGEAQARGLPPARYVNGDTPLFERIARFDAVFDRALVFRGASLHSDDIPADFMPDADPRTGRLTVSSTLRLTPPQR